MVIYKTGQPSTKYNADNRVLLASGKRLAPTGAETEPQVQRRYALRKKGQGLLPLTFFTVRITGVEPARVFPPEPKSGASANSAISA